jgi:hypothetical protein
LPIRSGNLVDELTLLSQIHLRYRLSERVPEHAYAAVDVIAIKRARVRALVIDDSHCVVLAACQGLALFGALLRNLLTVNTGGVASIVAMVRAQRDDAHFLPILLEHARFVENRADIREVGAMVPDNGYLLEFLEQSTARFSQVQIHHVGHVVLVV